MKTDAEMYALGEQVAKAMGPAFYAMQPEYNHSQNVRIRSLNNAGFKLRIFHEERKNKLVISGDHLKGEDGREFPWDNKDRADSIGMSDKSTPAKIAKSINSRLLDAYLTELEKGKVQLDEHNAYLARLASNKERIVKILNGEIRLNSDMVDGGHKNGGNLGYLWNCMVSGNSVQFDMRSMPIEVAEKVLGFWMSLKEEDFPKKTT